MDSVLLQKLNERKLIVEGKQRGQNIKLFRDYGTGFREYLWKIARDTVTTCLDSQQLRIINPINTRFSLPLLQGAETGLESGTHTSKICRKCFFHVFFFFKLS